MCVSAAFKILCGDPVGTNSFIDVFLLPPGVCGVTGDLAACFFVKTAHK